MGFQSRLFPRAPGRADPHDDARTVERRVPASPPAPPIPEPLLDDEPAHAEAEDEYEPPGFADLEAALSLVARGDVRSITLCELPDGRALLRVGLELAGEGIVVEPLVRSGGGGFDIRVRRAAPATT